MKRTAFLIVLTVMLGWAQAADQWPQYGGGASHNSVATGTAPVLTQTRLAVGASAGMSAAASPVVFDGKAYVYCPLGATTILNAYSVIGGALKWSVPVEMAVDDSWSSPAVDAASRSIIVATGQKVIALNADTGATRWSTPLGADVINASVTIAAGKAFVTTFAVYGDEAALAAVNLDSAAGTVGSIAWSVPIGSASGNTPAWYPGTGPADAGVIVANVDGYIRSYNPADGEPRWTYAAPGAGTFDIAGGAFFGGVSVDGDYAYVASYNFYGTGDNSFVYKLNAATGARVWYSPSERTDSVPVVAGDIVLLSAGLRQYGSVPKLQAFNKTTGAKLWETASMGGWTCTPLVVGGVAYVGTMSSVSSFFEYYVQLNAVDLSKTPSDSGFVIGSNAAAGGTPAYADGNVYSVGAGGLCAFGPIPHVWPIPCDANLDCKVNILDLILVRGKLGADVASGNNWQADVNADGKINILDLISVRSKLNTACPK